MFKLIARIFRSMDNAVSVIENSTKAASVASQSIVTVAEIFNAEQTAKLEAKQAVVLQNIEEGKYEL